MNLEPRRTKFREIEIAEEIRIRRSHLYLAAIGIKQSLALASGNARALQNSARQRHSRPAVGVNRRTQSKLLARTRDVDFAAALLEDILIHLRSGIERAQADSWRSELAAGNLDVPQPLVTRLDAVAARRRETASGDRQFAERTRFHSEIGKCRTGSGQVADRTAGDVEDAIAVLSDIDAASENMNAARDDSLGFAGIGVSYIKRVIEP